MAEEPLFFRDEAEMGDVVAAARQIIDQTRLSREERARVLKVTEDRIQQLTGNFIEYDSIIAHHEEYRKKIHRARVRLLKGECTADGATELLGALRDERDGIQKKYSGLVGILEVQMKNIETGIASLEAREALLKQQRDQYHSSLHMEVKWIAEGELKEIAGLRESLKKKYSSLFEDRSLILSKKDDLAESVFLLEEVIGKKIQRSVSAEEARGLELNYLARFDIRMNTFPVKLFSPLEGMTFPISKWTTHYRYDSGSNAGDDKKSIHNTRIMPLNAGSVYIFQQKDLRFFKKSHKKIVVEARSLGSLTDYADLGFDTVPVTISSLMASLRPVIHQAETGDYFHVIGIASPTGWDERVISWVTAEGFGGSYVSRHVAVCLIDSGSNQVYYNPNDLRIISYVDYFRTEFEKERVEKQKKIIRDEFSTVDYLEFEKVFEKTHEDRFIIRKAFMELEQEKAGRQKFVEGVGMVFMR